MDDNVMHLTFASSLSDICSKNSSFDSGVLQICYPGKNRNGSYFEKKDLIRCLPTMYNCPVVCNYDRESDSIGGHDIELVRKNGELKMVNKTVPVGVIPESAKYWFEEREDEGGAKHEYLFAEALIWKRQEAYDKLKNDGITSQSMEIHVNDGSVEDGVYHIRDFEFTAFTLIGVEPCFEGASLTMETFSAEDKEAFKRELSEMMQDLKDTYALVNPSDSEDDNKPTQDNTTKGGDEVLEDKMKLLEEFGKTAEDLDFSIEDLSLDDLRARLTSLSAEAEPTGEQEETEAVETEADQADEQAEENTDQEDTDPSAETAEENFELQGNVRDWLYEAVDGLGKIDYDGWSMPMYWMLDYDPDAGMVYCEDTKEWKIYGFSYSMDGDRVVIDPESKKRMKREFVAFEGDEPDEASAGLFALLSEKLNNKSEEYRAASEAKASMETELETLRKFKADAEKREAEEMKESLTAAFSDIAGTEAFAALMDHASEYSYAELEDKCYALRGRSMQTVKFSLEQKSPRLVVDKTLNDNESEPYGGWVARYRGDNR